MLENLRDSTSLFGKNIKPWELKLSFTLNDLNGKQQDAGTLTVTWHPAATQKLGRSATDVQSGLIQGPLSEAFEKKDLKILREAFLVQRLIYETVNPVDIYSVDELDVKQQPRKFGSVELSCLTVSPKIKHITSGYQIPTYCFQPELPNILRARLTATESSLRNRLGKFQGISLTLDNTLFYSGLIAISGKTESLRSLPEDEVVSSASSGTLDREPPLPIAGGVVAGQKISGANVEYPVMSRMAHEEGTVVISALIDKGGHIGRLVPIASPSGLLTGAAMNAVKTYVYKPYLLNGQPIEVDTTITVNFSLR